MKYRDNKWGINIQKEESMISCKCNCGLKHDIQLDESFNIIGRGTFLEKGGSLLESPVRSPNGRRGKDETNRI